MKKAILLFAAALCLFLLTGCSSPKFTGNELSNNCIEITGYSDQDATKLVIPAKVNGRTVTGIAARAFLQNRKLTSVVFPDTLTEIGDYAFIECRHLKQVTLPKSRLTIGLNAFSHCDLESLTIPEGTKVIKSSAFSDNRNLTSVLIPASLDNIGHNPFMSCTKLKAIEVDGDNRQFASVDGVLMAKVLGSVCILVSYPGGSERKAYVIPDEVTRIFREAFSGCKYLESVTVPGGVTNIESWTFVNCDRLSEIVLSEGVESISKSAFQLSAVTVRIPESVTSINKEAFFGSDSVKLIVRSGSYAEQFAKENGIDYICE